MQLKEAEMLGKQVDAGKIEQTLLRMLLVFEVSKKVETTNSLQN